MWIRNPQHDQMIRQKVLPINYLGRSVAHVDVSIQRIHTGDDCVGLKEWTLTLIGIYPVWKELEQCKNLNFLNQNRQFTKFSDTNKNKGMQIYVQWLPYIAWLEGSCHTQLHHLSPGDLSSSCSPGTAVPKKWNVVCLYNFPQCSLWLVHAASLCCFGCWMSCYYLNRGIESVVNAATLCI